MVAAVRPLLLDAKIKLCIAQMNVRKSMTCLKGATKMVRRLVKTVETTVDGEILSTFIIYEEGVSKKTVIKENPNIKRYGVLYRRDSNYFLRRDIEWYATGRKLRWRISGHK